MARDTDEWAWGQLHTVTLRNQTLGTSGIKPVEALFNRGPYEVGGGPAVVNAMAYDTTQGYTVTSAPTMRMVVDLGNLDQSRWVNQSGVSGHAFHRQLRRPDPAVGPQRDLALRGHPGRRRGPDRAAAGAAARRLSRSGSGTARCSSSLSRQAGENTRARGMSLDMINKMLDAAAARIERARGLDTLANPWPRLADSVLPRKWLTNLLSGTADRPSRTSPAGHHPDRCLELVAVLRRHGSGGGGRRPGRTRGSQCCSPRRPDRRQRLAAHRRRRAAGGPGARRRQRPGHHGLRR